MEKVTLQDDVATIFRGCVETFEVRDTTGRLLGYFQPYLSPEERAAYEEAEKLIDWQEIRRIAATEKTGRTIEEVMEYLRSLEKGQ